MTTIDNKDGIASNSRDDRFHILDDEELSQVLKNDTRKERDKND